MIPRDIAAFAAPVLLIGLAACSIGRSVMVPDSEARPPVDVPERFLVVSPDSGAWLEPSDDGRCRSPMVDPRDGTLLRLARSASRGDYTVPEGYYGVKAGELLRLNCATGRPVGIVPE